MDNRVALDMSSRPLGDCAFTNFCFSNDFYFSFMLGLVDFSKTAILCNRPNNCCHQNLKSVDQPLFALRWSETQNLKILIIDNSFSCNLMLMKLCTLIELGNT